MGDNSNMGTYDATHIGLLYLNSAIPKERAHQILSSEKEVPRAGLEPAIFGLEVRRVIHCANGAIGRIRPGFLWSVLSSRRTRSRTSSCDHIYRRAIRYTIRLGVFFEVVSPLATSGFDPPTSGLWARHAPSAPRCYFTTLCAAVW